MRFLVFWEFEKAAKVCLAEAVDESFVDFVFVAGSLQLIDDFRIGGKLQIKVVRHPDRLDSARVWLEVGA